MADRIGCEVLDTASVDRKRVKVEFYDGRCIEDNIGRTGEHNKYIAINYKFIFALHEVKTASQVDVGTRG